VLLQLYILDKDIYIIFYILQQSISILNPWNFL